MQRSVENRPKKRPELIIETLEANLQNKNFKRRSTFRNQVEIKPPMSAKNRHEIKHSFNFINIGQNSHNWPGKQQNKLRTLQRLQSEKIDLMKSLQILKQGAVSAIVQKQEQIIKLKQQVYSKSSSSIKTMQKEEEQNLNSKLIEKQLELKQLYRQELEEQVDELRRQLRKQRIRFESELYEKQEIINSLYVQLDQSYTKIQKLEQCDDYLNQKIRSIQNENISLLKQLQTSQHSGNPQLSNSFFLNISSVTQKGRHNRVNSFASEDTMFDDGYQFREHSYTLPAKKYSDKMILNQEDEDHLQNSFISQRIETIKIKLAEEVQHIKQHYEQQILKLKRIYQKENQNQKSLKDQKMMKKNSSTGSLHSVNSRHSDFDQNTSLLKFKTGSYANLHQGLSKTPSMETLKFQQRMYAIKQDAENDEAGTPRYHISLKDQILQREAYPSSNQYASQNYDTTTTISSFNNYFNNKNSAEKTFNYDTISQFTANHFEYPGNGIKFESTQKLFKRTNSIATFQGDLEQNLPVHKIHSIEEKMGEYNPESQNLSKKLTRTFSKQLIDSKGIIRMNTQSDGGDDDRLSTKSNHSNTSKSSIKKDLMLFCVGLVTGGTLFGLGSKILNK